MRVFIVAYGTRGDVQSCVALAHALGMAGHDAVLAAPESFEPLATGYKLRFAPLDDGLTGLWHNRQMIRRVDKGTRGIPAIRTFAESLRRPGITSLPLILEQIRAAARDVEIIVHASPVLASASRYIAQTLDVPLVIGQMYPLYTPTGAFPVPLYRFPGGDRLPPPLSRASYRLFQFMLSGVTRRDVEAWRATMPGPAGRRGRRSAGEPVCALTAVSPQILPRPRDLPGWVHFTGYWPLPAPVGWTPPDELADFIGAAEAPVYVGFGSAVSEDLSRLASLAAMALSQAGMRVVLNTCGNRIDPVIRQPRVHVLDEVPHDWLFRRMRAVVHHGGHGTTAAAIEAGRPQVICPFMADGPFWGERMRRLGVAPAPLPASTLSLADLVSAVRTVVNDPRMTTRARELAERVQRENGTAVAVALLEKIHAQGRSRVGT
jgi:sterol 3beta-glucosyltransferase